MLCGEQWQSRALQRCCHAVQRHMGMHWPGFAEEKTHGGGGVGLLGWRDPLSATRFLLSEREKTQCLTQDLCVSGAVTPK